MYYDNNDVCTSMHTCRGQRKIIDNLFYHSPSYSLERGSLIETFGKWLTNKPQVSTYFIPHPDAWVTGMYNHVQLLCG